MLTPQMIRRLTTSPTGPKGPSRKIEAVATVERPQKRAKEDLLTRTKA